MRRLLMVAVLAALAAALAWQQATIRRLEQAPAPVAAPAPVVWTTAPVDEEAVAARVTAAVERRLPPQPIAAPKAEEPPKEMPAQLERILSSGRAGKAELAELREKLREVNDPEVAGEVIRQLAVGYNSGRLIPEDPREVFP